ncbi:ethanolamine ammonia-lyase subunit EutC [soil metagenome]
MADELVRDPWSALRRLTAARIGLGRSGNSMPTRAALEFSLAHAQARDAVHAAFDAERVERDARALGLATVRVHSRAEDRAADLRRPDLGRRLDDAGRAALESMAGAGRCDIVFVIGDGLSSVAAMNHGAALVAATLEHLHDGWRIGPLVVAEQARVALGDEIGALLAADLVVVALGERPGLSSPDSLGLYITWKPRIGRHDAERTCVSNVRPGGLAIGEAAARLAWHLAQSRRLQLSGVALKDESDTRRVANAATERLD